MHKFIDYIAEAIPNLFVRPTVHPGVDPTSEKVLHHDPDKKFFDPDQKRCVTDD